VPDDIPALRAPDRPARTPLNSGCLRRSHCQRGRLAPGTGSSGKPLPNLATVQSPAILRCHLPATRHCRRGFLAAVVSTIGAVFIYCEVWVQIFFIITPITRKKTDSWAISQPPR
jgi:hypothetical protein